jgi:hypothetical protein
MLHVPVGPGEIWYGSAALRVACRFVAAATDVSGSVTRSTRDNIAGSWFIIVLFDLPLGS